jgi:hypothetical protein
MYITTSAAPRQDATGNNCRTRRRHSPQNRRHDARLSGLNAHTVGRTLNGRTEPYHKTFEALKAALVAEELRLRDYLLSLHPLPRADEERAA